MAHAEALGHVDRAKKLIATLPEGTERDEWELTFLVIEGPVRMTVDGWESPPAQRLSGRRESSRKGSGGRPNFPAIWGLWMGAHTSGQHVRAHELYVDIFNLLGQTNDPEYVVQAHHAGSSQMVAEGVPRAALVHVEQLLTNYRMDVHGKLALTYGAHDPACCSLGMRALSLLMLGLLDQAEAESAKALALSDQLDHKPSIAHTHMFRAELDIILNRAEVAGAHLDACISLSGKYSLAAYLNTADLMQGWVRVMRGEIETGIRQAEAALETLKSVPSRRFPPADTHSNRRTGKSGSRRYRGSVALFEAGLDAASITGETWYEPGNAPPESRGADRPVRATNDRSRTMSDDRDYCRAEARGEVLGTQSRNGTRWALGTTGATHRGPRSPRADLWLVY